VLTFAGNSLASHRTMTRERSARRGSQPAQLRQDERAQHHQAQGQQAEPKHVAAECSHRDISHAGGSESESVEASRKGCESHSTLRRKAATFPAIVMRAPAPRVYCGHEDGVRCHGLAASGSDNVVSKTSQARGMAAEAQDRDPSRHHAP